MGSSTDGSIYIRAGCMIIALIMSFMWGYREGQTHQCEAFGGVYINSTMCIDKNKVEEIAIDRLQK